MKYSSGYKYQLRETFTYQCGHVRPDKAVMTDWILLTASGLLTIQKGYAWDGASGPTFDTRSSMRGGLVHDALFQLMRLGLLDRHIYFHPANREFHDLLVADGMFRWRARLWFNAVDDFSKFATTRKAEPRVLTAP